MPTPTCSSTLAAAATARPARSNWTVSKPNVEKVVKPPTRPVTSRSRALGPSAPRYSAAPINKPITKQPARLTTVVPHGNDDGFVHAATIVEDVQRRTEPVAPPSATKRNCDRERLSVSAGTAVLRSRGYP